MNLSENIRAKLDAYITARKASDEAHRKSAEAMAVTRAVEKDFIDAMVDAGVKSLNWEDGIAFHLAKRFSISVNKDNDYQVREWLTTVHGDVHKFEKLILHKPTVTTYVKEQIEHGELDLSTVPEFLALKTSPTLNVRGWKGPQPEETNDTIPF